MTNCHELLTRYRALHKECQDLTGQLDALQSQRRDWRCELCKEADAHMEPTQ